MIKQLLNGKKVELFTDEYRCMAAGRSVAAAMLMLCYSPYSGICHVAGPDRLSRYEFGCIVADKLHLDKTLIQPSLSKALQTIIKRPLDVSLSCDKLKTYVGSKLLSVHQADNLLLNAAKHI